MMSRVGSHRFWAIGQNGDAAVVVPIMQDRAQHKSVRPGRYAVKETAADDRATRFHAARRRERRRARHDVGEIEENATRARMGGENVDKQATRSTAYVRDAMEWAEVVGGQQRRRESSGRERHGLAEQG